MNTLWNDETVGDPVANWVERVTSAGRFKVRGKDTRAPYKPLLLLWMIGRLVGGQPAAVAFKEAEADLRRLLGKHAVGRTKPKPEHPFIYLASDPQLWRIEDPSGVDVAGLPSKVKSRAVFLRDGVVGSLAPEFELALHDPGIRSAVVNALLQLEFPETLHEQVLADVGLVGVVPTTKTARDPRFKSTVLRAYEDRCSFCGYDLRLDGSPVGIDAAHVQMRSRGGPDRVENGLALCVQHHRLFDYGALGLDHDHRIQVSEQLNLSDQDSAERIRSLIGERIRIPLRRYRMPAPEHIDWHTKNLFKHPAR